MKKNKRILMLYDFPMKGGGSGTYVKYLSLRLREAYNYTVAIASPDKDSFDPSIQNFHINLPQIPVYVSRPGLENAKRYSQLNGEEIADIYDAFNKGVINAIKEFKPDIIHVHHTLVNSWAARFIRSIYGTKFIVTTHGSCLEVIAQDRRYFRLTRDALWAASAVTAVSAHTRKKIIKMFGTDISAKTRTIPGGVRASLFPEKKSEEEKEAIAKEFGLNRDKKIVLFTGRLITEKGVEYLIKAATRIPAQIVIAGDGPQKKTLEEYIKQKSIPNVIFMDFLKHEDLLPLYYIADVFVAPSIWDDPMPLTILEAMASGLPLVVTSRGGIPFAVRDGYNGFFVRSRNATNIVEKVNFLLENDKMRSKMGEKSREIALKRFTWTSVADRFHNVYTNI